MLRLKVQSHRLLRACLLGSKAATTSSLSGPTDFPLWSAVKRVCSALAPKTVIRILCQALEPTAFLVHPVLAAVAEDAVAAHSSATDGAWKLA